MTQPEVEADVSVVIASHRRPHACRAAVMSALGQTLPPHEVLLVVDGTDNADYDAVEDAIGDKRLRVLRPGRQLGAAAVRNLGVSEAAAHSVAFLDDDDVWLPTKLDVQLGHVHAAVGDAPFVSTSAMVAFGTGRATRWPARDPAPGEPVADFLFGLGAPPRRGRVLQTSTFLASRDVALATPMRGRAYEDWDWLIRASLLAPYVHVPQPLAMFQISTGSLTSKLRVDEAESWLEQIRPLISPEAYAAGCLTVLATRGATSGSGRDVARAFLRGIRHHPDPRLVAAFPLRVGYHRLAAHRSRRADR